MKYRWQANFSILSGGGNFTGPTPVGQPCYAVQDDQLWRGSALLYMVSPYIYSSKTFQVLLTEFVILFLMPGRAHLAYLKSGTGYSLTLPYTVVCAWLCCGHSCWSTGFSSLVQKAPYGKCGFLKIFNFLSTLASVKLLTQVLVSVLKNCFLQVNLNRSRGNPVTILNALKIFSSIAFLLLLFCIPMKIINSVIAIQ